MRSLERCREHLDLAREHFDLPREGLRAEAGDGRRLLRRSRERYHAIVVDAYRAAYVPPHLVTREFFELARERLTPDGVLALNLLSARRWLSEEEASDEGPLVEACLATAAQVFPHTALLDVANGLNTILFASGRELGAKGALAALRTVRGRRSSLVRHLEDGLPRLRAALPDPEAHLLTDDRCPTAWLTHRLALARLFGRAR